MSLCCFTMKLSQEGNSKMSIGKDKNSPVQKAFKKLYRQEPSFQSVKEFI